MGIKRSEIVLASLEDEEKAFKMLLREKLTNDKKSLCDEIFINQKIAEYYNKKNNELKYYYIDELKKIFNCERAREIFRFDFAKFLNLYTNIYEKEIDEKTHYKILKEICKIYRELESDYFHDETIRKFSKFKEAEELEAYR